MGKQARKSSTVHLFPQELKARNPTQSQYITSLNHNNITVAIGPAGTGKTYIPSISFSNLYLNGKISKIIVTRPTVECGDKLGALPGELDEKFEPWVKNIYRSMKSVLSGKIDCDMKKDKINFIPMQYMRGETFDNSAIIVDEAQNLTIEQAKMIITRIGKYSKMVLCGDLNQTDLKKQKSGLAWFVEELQRQQTTGIDIVRFTMDDCQRSETCKQMIELINRSKKE